jgi:hypothetical protein
MTYINHSGGCEGADMAWETAGKVYGVKTISYSFDGHRQYGENPYIMTVGELNEGWEACKIASKSLDRPLHENISTYVRQLICRNWFQVKHAEAIYAIGTLVKGSDTLVNGGTGWAVQMAVDNKKPVYLFEQDLKEWMRFDYHTNCFIRHDWGAPKLTNNFAGIGTRAITDDGLRAILNVYENTFYGK